MLSFVSLDEREKTLNLKLLLKTIRNMHIYVVFYVKII